MFGDNRTRASVTVLAPDNPMRGTWQLLWTTKREGDVRKSISTSPLHNNIVILADGYGTDERLGRFHSQVAIDPINNKTYLEVDEQRKSTLLTSYFGTDTDDGYAAGQIFSATQFSLPPFIQDYGPGPNPEPEDEFDAVMREIMREVDSPLWNKQ